MKFSPDLTAQEVQAAFGDAYSAVSKHVSGGQGDVFKATPKVASGQAAGNVALKIYFPGSLAERTQREVDALCRIRCGSLVQLHDAGRVDLRGQVCMFVATAFIEGEVLSLAIGRGPLGADRVARVGRDIAAAVDALWQERIVHRDIKPSNIMVDGNGSPFLIDLGVARHIALSPLTTTGKTWGTEGYMSPEQAHALRQLSCKSDVFALGIVLQESFTGRHPTGYNQIALALGGPRTATLAHGLPPVLCAFIDLMVAGQPHLRPTPAQVVAALTPFC
jgi:serine/threonine protein kinase